MTTIHQLMTVERIHPKAPVMLIFIAIFTCLPSCINLSNINKSFVMKKFNFEYLQGGLDKIVTHDETGSRSFPFCSW